MPYVWCKARTYGGTDYKPGQPFPADRKPKRSMISGKVVTWVSDTGEPDPLAVRAAKGDRAIDHMLPPKVQAPPPPPAPPKVVPPTVKEVVDAGYSEEAAKIIVALETKSAALVNGGMTEDAAREALASEMIEAQKAVDNADRDALDEMQEPAMGDKAEEETPEPISLVVPDGVEPVSLNVPDGDEPIDLNVAEPHTFAKTPETSPTETEPDVEPSTDEVSINAAEAASVGLLTDEHPEPAEPTPDAEPAPEPPTEPEPQETAEGEDQPVAEPEPEPEKPKPAPRKKTKKKKRSPKKRG